MKKIIDFYISSNDLNFSGKNINELKDYSIYFSISTNNNNLLKNLDFLNNIGNHLSKLLEKSHDRKFTKNNPTYDFSTNLNKQENNIILEIDKNICNILCDKKDNLESQLREQKININEYEKYWNGFLKRIREVIIIKLIKSINNTNYITMNDLMNILTKDKNNTYCFLKNLYDNFSKEAITEDQKRQKEYYKSIYINFMEKGEVAPIVTKGIKIMLKDKFQFANIFHILIQQNQIKIVLEDSKDKIYIPTTYLNNIYPLIKT